MDFRLFDNNECISLVYGNIIPSFNDIEITSISIDPHNETELVLEFDTLELPHKMPEEWLLDNVSMLHVEISFECVNIERFSLGKGWKFSFSIKHDKGNKFVVLKNKFDNSEICFSVKKIFAKRIYPNIERKYFFEI